MNNYVAQATVPMTARKWGVLVADDEAEIRDVLQHGLQLEGFSVWLAADGQEALDLYRDRYETIDVVLLDVLMPRLDGPRTMAAIQALTPQIPCCLMSGYLGAYTDAGLCTQGARAIIKKPFVLPEVARLLRYVADGIDLYPTSVRPVQELCCDSGKSDGSRETAPPAERSAAIRRTAAALPPQPSGDKP